MRKTIIWRSDDISASTDISVLKKVHQHFRDALVMHTVTIIAKDFDTRPDLIAYLKENNFDIQLHCWEHYNFVENEEKLYEDIPKCLAMFEKCGFDRPTHLYPPWNHIINRINIIVRERWQIRLSWEKISIAGYIRNKGHIRYPVVNFHYWNKECEMLPEALSIYNSLR